MRRYLHHSERGAVLVMVTLVLLAMCGMLGLVVDLGWSYFVKKSAQAAADTAALAAVKAAKDKVSLLADYKCSGGIVECAPVLAYCETGFAGNLQSACNYAEAHGFVDSSDGRQRVSIQAWDRSSAPTITENCGQGGAEVRHPPTAGCVDTYYWVTVRVVERIPQLFSSILGNTEGTVSARATAAVAQSETFGSLILINRETEQWSQTTGTNLYVGGGPEVRVPGGIVLASGADGPQVPQDPWAGFISGNGVVNTYSSSTFFRSDGWYAISGGGQWLGSKTKGGTDFDDPMRGRGQPPLTATQLPAVAVPGGALNSVVCGGTCVSGNYYAAAYDSFGNPVSTGEPIVINSDLRFEDGAFGNFNFYGGVKVGQATVTFGPGRYGLFGVKNPDRTLLFDNENKAQLLSTSNSDAGRIFILSDTNYPGVASQVAMLPANRQWTSLPFSKTSIKAGNNASSRVELYGLDRLNSNVIAAGLDNFAPALIWQDQRNSYVGYTPEGYVDVYNDDLNSPKPGGVAPPSDSPQLELWATPFAKLVGLIYQPRGAWTVVQAAGDYQGPLRIVSGAMELQGTGKLTLTGESPPIINYTTALVE
jgi:Putative Flp pilus-assembly TadE/G-like